MSRKLTYEYVKEQIENFNNYKLHSTKYKNNSTKLDVECDKGHRYNVTWANFQKGTRCPECIGVKKLTFEFIKEQIEKENYILHSTEYVNNSTKLDVECNKGHRYKVNWNDFHNGNRCPVCAGNKKLTYDQVKEQIEKDGYKLLSKEYINANTKMEIRCDKNHIYSTTWDIFKQGHRCPVCAGLKKYTYVQVKEQIEKDGYKLLSKEYINNKTKLDIKCPLGHNFKMNYSKFRYGQKCPVCWQENSQSKAEKEVQEFVKSLFEYETVICNDRTQILNHNTGYYLELDVYLPNLNKAIEYNGIFWHSKPEQKIKDKIKKDQCKEKGIDLLVIDEQLYIADKYKILDKIKDFVI